VSAHVCRIRPLFADTDAGGVVYYGTYLRYLEEARTQAVECAGISLRAELSNGCLYPVTHVDIDYQTSVPFGETLCITTDVTEIGRVRFRLDHRLYLEASGAPVGRATVWLACVDRDSRRPRRLSAAMADALVQLRSRVDTDSPAS